MHGQPLRKIAHPRFRRAVGGDFRQGAIGVHRGNVDDVSARFHHVLGKYLGHQKCGGDVDIENKLQSAFLQGKEILHAPKLGRHRLVVACRARLVSARAVDQKVHLAPFCADKLFRLLDIFLIEAVASDGNRVFTDLRRVGRRALLVDIQKRHFRAARRQRARKFAANHAARARNRRHLAHQIYIKR